MFWTLEDQITVSGLERKHQENRTLEKHFDDSFRAITERLYTTWGQNFGATGQFLVYIFYLKQVDDSQSYAIERFVILLIQIILVRIHDDNLPESFVYDLRYIYKSMERCHPGSSNAPLRSEINLPLPHWPRTSRQRGVAIVAKVHQLEKSGNSGTKQLRRHTKLMLDNP